MVTLPLIAAPVLVMLVIVPVVTVASERTGDSMAAGEEHLKVKVMNNQTKKIEKNAYKLFIGKGINSDEVIPRKRLRERYKV
jgi:hypothetical protein